MKALLLSTSIWAGFVITAMLYVSLGHHFGWRLKLRQPYWAAQTGIGE